jgi:transcriptional regulator with XRE-family HTH domain
MTLDEYMASCGLSEKALADLLRVSRVSVNRWRNGERFPSKPNLEGLYRVTKGAVTAADFFELSTASQRRAG